jgi:hypothetical protein
MGAILFAKSQVTFPPARPYMEILKQGEAMRVFFFYPGEEGTYIDRVRVTLYTNGVVHIVNEREESTTHLQNCEIVWRFESDEERHAPVRLLRTPRDP